jgi:hypothetical protein
MNHKLLFVSLSAALALGAVATAAVAAPGGLNGVRSASGSVLLHAIHDDDDRGRSWSRRSGWADDDRGYGRWWWWHHRNHRDRDRDDRGSGH